MNDTQLIERLRHCAGCDDCAGCQDFEKEGYIEDLLSTAADRISDLLTELKDERHRHDRYVDFELAQAEELRKLKEQTRWIPVTECGAYCRCSIASDEKKAIFTLGKMDMKESVILLLRDNQQATVEELIQMVRRM